jgi:hypothetical protein
MRSSAGRHPAGGYVPDAGHSRLIELCVNDPNIHDVVLTTEEGASVSWPAPRSAASALRC